MQDRWRHLVERIPHWGRVVMNRDIAGFLEGLPRHEIDCLEVSGRFRADHGWRSYERTAYPDFDLCARSPLEAAFDLVFCEQVLEHVPDPVQASRNLFALIRPGGFAVVSVPFMVRIHREPEDYWRFSPAGLRVLLERAGFEVERVEGWGSRASVLANLWVWCPYIPIVHSLANSSATPLVVWAVARKPKLPQ
jgi:SAM-dependent methyltransferase